MKTKTLLVLLLPCLATLSMADTKYILRYTESEPLADFLAQHKLKLEATVENRPIHSVIDKLDRDPDALIDQVSEDSDGDVSIELDQIIKLPILSFRRNQTIGTKALKKAHKNNQVINFFGIKVPAGYTTQSHVAQSTIDTSWLFHGPGTSIVAVIDTGVDISHPVFKNGTVPGLDFINPSGKGSEFKGLTSEVLAMINPTTTPLLQVEFAYMSKGHAAALEPEVRLNSNFSSIPIGLGHGTMVAGAIKLVAPAAKIMPIRAFSQDGTGRLFHIISAIHAAENRGAKVINLSLNTYTYSPELEQTSEDVSDRGVILVASTGNDGLINVPTFPASLSKVTGVASMNPFFQRSTFSNAGESNTWVAAPGEAILLPYPGKRWAGGWGTSFSAPLVSGLAAKLLNFKPDATYSDLQSALGKSTPINDQNLGLGGLNVFESVDGI